MAKTITYTTGIQDITDPSQVDGVTIRLAGTALATAPTLSLIDTAPPPVTTAYLLGKIEVLGTAATPNFGSVEFYRLFFAGHLDAGYPRLARNTLNWHHVFKFRA